MTSATGCLLLHGFTSSLDTVNPLVPYLEKAGIAYEMPVLRGHGTRPEDLVGVKWTDWLDDATAALKRLTANHRPVVIAGLSMGGLLALHLAARFPMRVAGVASISTCLRFKDPLIYALPLLSQVYTWWEPSSPPRYIDPQAAATDTNYQRFPVDAFLQLYRYSHVVREELPRVQCPLLVLQSSIDATAQPESAIRIYRECRSLDKQVVWFHNSHHELLRDAQRDVVCAQVMQFIERVCAAQPALSWR